MLRLQIVSFAKVIVSACKVALALAVLFACRHNFGAYNTSPLQPSTVKTDSGSSSTGAGPASALSLRKPKTSSAAQKSASSSAEMESGLLGAAALELVALPSHSAAAAANGGDVSSSLRVSAVLDIVFSEGGGEEGCGIAGGSAPGSLSSVGAMVAKEAVAAAIQKSKTEAKAKATEFLDSELMGFMGSLGFA